MEEPVDLLMPSCGPACPVTATVRVEQVVDANCCSAVVIVWPLIPGSALWLINRPRRPVSNLQCFNVYYAASQFLCSEVLQEVVEALETALMDCVKVIITGIQGNPVGFLSVMCYKH